MARRDPASPAAARSRVASTISLPPSRPPLLQRKPRRARCDRAAPPRRGRAAPRASRHQGSTASPPVADAALAARRPARAPATARAPARRRAAIVAAPWTGASRWRACARSWAAPAACRWQSPMPAPAAASAARGSGPRHTAGRRAANYCVGGTASQRR
eukprot:scaffold130237_cov75-Phaeocystis_antarctica.AAC.5